MPSSSTSHLGMQNANNPTFLTSHNQKNFELNSAGFSIVENIPFLLYIRSVDLMSGRKWSQNGQQRPERGDKKRIRNGF